MEIAVGNQSSSTIGSSTTEETIKTIVVTVDGIFVTFDASDALVGEGVSLDLRGEISVIYLLNDDGSILTSSVAFLADFADGILWASEWECVGEFEPR